MSAVFKKDGKFLRYSEATTHTGTHRNAEWVEDLQQATVFYAPPPYQLRKDGLAGAKRVEVLETRAVAIVAADALPGGQLERVVMLYTFSDGFTYDHPRVFPLMAESTAAALVAFEDAYQQAKATGASFSFAGEKFYSSDFEDNGKYFAPDFLTVDEWFAQQIGASGKVL